MKLVGINSTAKRMHRATVLVGFTLITSPLQAAVVVYGVDPASGRVTTATYPDGTYITYGYDANGNRISAVITDLGAPTAPGTPNFSSIGATSATASWTPATDNVAVTGYQYRVNSGSWVSVSNSPASLTGLSGATMYTVEVRAKDNADNFGPASSNSFTTLDNGVPTAPGTPTFSSVTATSATATWTAATDNVAVTGYQYSLNGGAWTSNGTSLSVALTSLTTATGYTLRVRAHDGASNIGPESANSFTTLDNLAPSAPGTPSFTSIAQNSATASWTAASDNVAVTSYEYSLNGGAWTSNGASLSVNLTSLSAGTNYSMQVRAKDAANNTGSASLNSFNTTDTTAPSAPGTPGFSSITASSATASWTAATDNVAVTSYEYSLNGGAWTSNGASLSRNLTSLSAGTNYTLQVRAKDAANNTGSASSNSFTTVDNVAPSAPGTPSFTSIAQNSATASWTAATDNVAVTSYEYSLNGGAWTSNGTSLSKSFTGLTAATSYTVQVRAKDAANNTGSASSNSFNTTDTTAPSVPGTPGFSSITASSATASWTAATDNVAVTSYEYSLNGGAWTSTGASLSVNLTSLSAGTNYSLQVRAKDAANNTGSASSNSFTTVDNVAPSAPGTPSFSSITGTSATASWTAASDNVAVTGYEYSLNGGSWTSNGMSLSVGLSSLSPATNYSLQLRARDGANNTGSASSNSFTTVDTIAPGVPGTPSFSSVTGNSATASWSAASDNVAVTGYEYRLNAGSWIANASTSVNITGLSPNTSYTVDVRAKDAANNAGGASSNSFTTPVAITIGNRSVSTHMVGFMSAANYQLTSAGDILTSMANSSAMMDVGDWLSPKSGMSNFQVRRASGGCNGPAVGQWIQLNNSPNWSITVGSPNTSAFCSMTIEISAVANPSVILGTAVISLSASRS